MQWVGGSGSRRKRKRFEWNEISSLPGDDDALQEEKSGDSLTVHSTSAERPRLVNTSSDDSNKVIEDSDSEE